MKRKICVVTGSRADYGLLYWTLREIDNSPDLDLQLIVTGMHLSSEFGKTIEQIEEDGFDISYRVDMLLSSDSAEGVAKSTGLGIIGFTDAFRFLAPDLVLLLGDRFEIFAAASAAMLAVIPIAHLHGGEVTTGAFDDAIRHSISKMSHLHFTSTEVYRQRVIQLGENPTRVFNVGAPGIENIRWLDLLTKNETEQQLGAEFGPRSLLITFHPVTLHPGTARQDFEELLCALSDLRDVNLIFTKANADTEGRGINQIIEAFVRSHRTAVVHSSLGQIKYLSAMKYVTGVVGNSSSGIIEAPSLKTGTVNIGDRQEGRVRATSVIDCGPAAQDISAALETLFSQEFQEALPMVVNPHGEGDVASKIVQTLTEVPLDNLVNKVFHNISSKSG